MSVLLLLLLFYATVHYLGLIDIESEAMTGETASSETIAFSGRYEFINIAVVFKFIHPCFWHFFSFNRVAR